MRASKYMERITVQKLTKTENDIGGWSNSWTDLFECWASVVPASRAKRLEYAALKYDEFFEVEMRIRIVNLDGDCRIVYNGNDYQIISFTVDGGAVKVDIIR